MAAQNTPNMGLFGILPPEIRNMIYELHLPKIRDVILVNKPKPELHFPALMLASKDLCAEIKPIIDASRWRECNMQIHLCRKQPISFTNGLMLRPRPRHADEAPKVIRPRDSLFSRQVRFEAAVIRKPRHFFKMPLPMPDLQEASCNFAAVRTLHIHVDVQRQRWSKVAYKMDDFGTYSSRLTGLTHLSIAFGRDDFRWNPSGGIVDRSELVEDDEASALELLKTMLDSFIKNVNTLMKIEFPFRESLLGSKTFSQKARIILEEVLSHSTGGRVKAEHQKVGYVAGEMARLGMCDYYSSWPDQFNKVYWDQYSLSSQPTN